MIMENGGMNIRIGFASNEKPYATYKSTGINMPIKDLLDINKEYFNGPYTEYLGHDHLVE